MPITSDADTSDLDASSTTSSFLTDFRELTSSGASGLRHVRWQTIPCQELRSHRRGPPPQIADLSCCLGDHARELLAQVRPSTVLFGHHAHGQRPSDTQRRIIPPDTPSRPWLIRRRDLVETPPCDPPRSACRVHIRWECTTPDGCPGTTRMPTHWPNVAESGRTSTATSNTAPRVTRTSFASPYGAA